MYPQLLMSVADYDPSDGYSPSVQSRSWAMSADSYYLDDKIRTLGYLQKWNLSNDADDTNDDESKDSCSENDKGYVYEGDDNYEYLTLDPLKVSGFPGANSSIDEKVDWFARLDKARSDEGEKNYFTSRNIADTLDIANAIFYHACPDEIGVVFKMKRENVEAMDIPSFSADYAKKNGLMFNALRGFTNTYKSYKVETDESKQINWANYKKWLLETQKTEFIIIGTDQRYKGQSTVHVLKEFTRDMGLDLIYDALYVEVTDKVNEAVSDNSSFTRWGMQHYLGENFYSKTPDELKDKIRSNVCMEVLIEVGELEDLSDWELELIKAMVKSRENNCAKKFHLVEKSDTNDDSCAATPENHHVFWISSYHDELEGTRASQHFRGFGESVEIKNRLEKGNTDTGNIKISIFEKEVECLQNGSLLGVYGNKPEHRLCAALNLTTAVLKNAWCFLDSEYHDDIPLIMKDLSAYWRLNVLKCSDEELGILPPECDSQGTKTNEEEVEDGISPSRAALYRLLEIYAKNFKDESNEYCKMNFDWKPKKRNSSALANVDGNAKKARKPPTMLKDATKKYTPSAGFEVFTQDAAVALHNKILRNQNNLTEKDAKQRCWQLKCTYVLPNGKTAIRVLLLTGDTPMYGLTKVISESFQWRESGTRYETALTKGVIPAGSFWTIEMEKFGDTNAAGLIGAQKVLYKAVATGAPFFDLRKVKVFQVLGKRGDKITYHYKDDLKVEVSVQGMQTTTSGFRDSSKYCPAVVGSSSGGFGSLTKSSWDAINSRLLGTKQEKAGLITLNCATEDQIYRGFHDFFQKPLFDNKGIAFDRDERIEIEEMHRNVVSEAEGEVS